MKIGLITDCLSNLSFEEMLKTAKKLNIEQVELGVGNWSSAPHINLDELLKSEAKRDEMKGMLSDYNISISAFNCSGNPLAPKDWGKHDQEITAKCFKLSEYFGLDTVVMMSGLPAGGPNDEMPNWVTTSWPKETLTMLKYQWEEVAIPYWKKAVNLANASGVTKLALEPHGAQLVHNIENFYRLREAVGDNKTIGFNLDPSHLFWMGADPISIARELNEFIYHVHIKDVRIENASRINTMLDGKEATDFTNRSWNFSIPTLGHDENWWREFIKTLKTAGYDGVLSIEHEDYSIELMTALEKTVKLLEAIRA